MILVKWAALKLASKSAADPKAMWIWVTTSGTTASKSAAEKRLLVWRRRRGSTVVPARMKSISGVRSHGRLSRLSAYMVVGREPFTAMSCTATQRARARGRYRGLNCGESRRDLQLLPREITTTAPMVTTSPLKSRHKAQVNGIRFVSPLFTSIRWVAARVWMASMLPAQKSATPMIAAVESPVLR